MTEWTNPDMENTVNDQQQVINLVNRLKAHWYWFVLSGILGLAAAFVYLRYATPMYMINAKVLVSDEKKGAGLAGENPMLEGISGMLGAKSTVDNEVEILKTRTLMERVVEDLCAYITYFHKGNLRDAELYEAPFEVRLPRPRQDFSPATFSVQPIDEGRVEVSAEDFSRTVRYHEPFDLKGIGTASIARNTAVPYEKESYLFTVTAFDQQVANYLGRLNVKVTNKLVTVIDLGFQYPVKKKGEEILSTLISAYVSGNVQDKNTVADSTIAFIEDRLLLVGRELEAVEKRIQQFKQVNKLTDMSAQSQLLIENSSEHVNDLAKVETQLSIMDRIRTYLEDDKGLRILPSAELLNDVVFKGLLERYNVLLLQRDRALLGSTPNNPAVVNLSNQITSLRQDMLGNIGSTIHNLEITRNDLEGKIGQIESKIRTVPATERMYLGLARQQQIRQELYVFLLQKREETAIGKTSNLSNCKVIDFPKAAVKPVSPRRTLAMALGFMLGLVIPACAVYLNEIFNTRVRKKEDVSRETSLPVIAEISHNDQKGKDLVVEEGARSQISEEFRSLRTNLAFYLKSDNQKTILLSSSMGGEGKSFVAVNLAMVMALSGKKVVMMEMDLRKPNIMTKLDVKGKLGFSNYVISGDITPEDIIVPSGIHPDLYVISAGPIPPNPSEMIMSSRTSGLMQALHKQFDYIIIDAPPVGLVTDAQLLSEYADITLYLVRHAYTHKSQLRQLNALYKEGKMGRMALLMNDIKRKGGGYGYGYGYQGYYTDSRS
ncbi:GumC family protein [Chitinophaga cymbidii]|uniref:Tyrosine protein kinase n=1 Tax=Chitinophaga cymbidii TaxID=1096750 RepID=A0A512RP35_9BACT|nr:tyrosine-protein kinase [Chitinophaga cymbidii]GEP97447.1 tyrosine protein kinase [Chitinophaga cymbidii]